MNEKVVKVLLIEDNPGDVRLIGEWLAEANGAAFELEHADRLAAGLERLSRGQIDAILLDLSLPDSKGLDTFNRTYATAPCVPILLLAGPEDEAQAGQAVREGAQDCLVKGQADGRRLTRAIRYAVERQQAERGAAAHPLRESEHFAQAVISSVGEGVVDYDRELRYRAWNRFMEDLTGFRADRVLVHVGESPPLVYGRGRHMGIAQNPCKTSARLYSLHNRAEECRASRREV